MAPVAERSPSPVPEEQTNPELARYLNRSYWESLNQNDSTTEIRAASPSAPATAPSTESVKAKLKENGVVDHDLEDFISTLKSQVEVFINRMKGNSSRGRSVANDTSVQALFMNITAMHSKLLRYIQQHDDSRLHYERLQDKLTQMKDARAALDDLRDEHREKLRRDAEEAERQRQLQMAHKLDIMRKKKQEYLQYQRQLALQRIQEQEREMQMRQEHQKQQYLMGYMGTNQFPQTQPPNSAPPQQQFHGYQFQQSMMPPQSAPQMNPPPGMQHQVQSGPGQQPHFQPMPNYGMPPQQMMNMGSPMTGPIPMQQPPQNPAIPSQPQQHFQQQPGPGPTQPQPLPQHERPKAETRTAELISFDD